MFYNRWIAKKYWLGLALIVSYIQSHEWDIEVKDMRKELWMEYWALLSRLLHQQEKWNIIWMGEPTASWWYKRYEINKNVLWVDWPLVERKVNK